MSTDHHPLDAPSGRLTPSFLIHKMGTERAGFASQDSVDPSLSTQHNAWHMVGAWGSWCFLTHEPQFCLQAHNKMFNRKGIRSIHPGESTPQSRAVGLGLQEHSSFPSLGSSHPTPSCPCWKVRSCGLEGQGPCPQMRSGTRSQVGGWLLCYHSGESRGGRRGLGEHSRELGGKLSSLGACGAQQWSWELDSAGCPHVGTS